MKNIKLIFLFGFMVSLCVLHNYKVGNDFVISSNLNQLVMAYDEAKIFAEAVVYMIDLDLDRAEDLDFEVLNQDYFECFNYDYITKFLADRPSYLSFMKNFASKEEVQFADYMNNKNAHNSLTQGELSLLYEYNKICYEYHKILNYNDEILSLIAQKNGISLAGLKEMHLYTPTHYEKIIYGDEEYSYLLKSTYLEMSQELQTFKNKYHGLYPFNYEVELPWEYKFTTSQYDASLYNVQYQDVTEDFYVIYTRYICNDDILLQNKYRLISYTVYNDCIEVRFTSQQGFMSAIASITDGEISYIFTYIQENQISERKG